MAVAVLTVAALAFLLPDDFRPLPGWIFQVLLLAFLVVLMIGDPGRIDRDSRWLHITTNLMIAVITVGNTWAAARLVRGILTNAKFTDAQDLLQIGASVWLVNVIAFALWYWHLDCGGAAAASERQHRGHSGVRLSRVRSPRARRRPLVPTVRRLPRDVVQHRDSIQPDRCVGREAVGQAPRHGRIERFPRRCAPCHCPSDQRLPGRRFLTAATAVGESRSRHRGRRLSAEGAAVIVAACGSSSTLSAVVSVRTNGPISVQVVLVPFV